MRSYITPLRVLTLVTGLLVALSAVAKTMRMTVLMDVSTHQSRSTYQPAKDKDPDGWFYLTESVQDVEISSKLTMSGQADQAQHCRTTVHEVPGSTPGLTGYQRARLERRSATEIALIIETKLTRKKTKDGKEVEEKDDRTERIPLEPTRAAAKKGIAGTTGPVLQIAKAGMKQLLERAETEGKAGVQLKVDGEGARASMAVKAWHLKRGFRGAVFVSPTEIVYEAPPMRVRAEGGVSLSGPDVEW